MSSASNASCASRSEKGRPSTRRSLTSSAQDDLVDWPNLEKVVEFTNATEKSEALRERLVTSLLPPRDSQQLLVTAQGCHPTAWPRAPAAPLNSKQLQLNLRILPLNWSHQEAIFRQSPLDQRINHRLPSRFRQRDQIRLLDLNLRQ